MTTAAGITHARLQRGEIRVALEGGALLNHNFTFTRESRFLDLADHVARCRDIVKGTRKSANICARTCALTPPSSLDTFFQIPTWRDTGMQRDGTL